MAVSQNTIIARRSILKGLAAVPLIGGAFVGMIGRADAFDPADLRILNAYSNWLYSERRYLCREMWPAYGDDADVWIPMNTGVDHYHAPLWNGGRLDDYDPSSAAAPSTRAVAVLKAVGIDPQRAIERGI